MRSFAQGPWTYQEGVTLLHIETSIDSPRPGIPICSINVAKKAEADLISAAPDLLEALANIHASSNEPHIQAMCMEWISKFR